MTKREIAEAFSHGEFEHTFRWLAEDVQWTVVGESFPDGKLAVIDQCRQVAGYFKSVVTNFKTDIAIADGNYVVINGTAEFIREGERVNFVSACDIYEFNNQGELQKITSYCIADRK